MNALRDWGDFVTFVTFDVYFYPYDFFFLKKSGQIIGCRRTSS